MILDNDILSSRLEEIMLAPLNYPEIIPTLLPLAIGWVILELYFGKHKDERLGWNTSVGNAVLWIATGISLLMTGNIETTLERNVTYFIIAAGVFVAYMDFYHKWSSSIAFRISSADAIYPLAYVTVIIVNTDIPVNTEVLQASAVFIAGSVVVFHIIRFFEIPARDSFRAVR